MAIYPYSFTMPPVNKQDIPSDGVVGEFLGISAGGVLDWLPVSGGSGSGDLLAANNLSELTPTAGTARTNLGLGTGDSPTFANLTLTSPSLSSSAPVTISQTWNNAAVAFTGLKVNAAGTSATNSASGSLLLDLQVGTVSQFKVTKTGVAIVPSGSSSAPSLCFIDSDNGFYKLSLGVGYSTSTNTSVFTASYNGALGMLQDMFLGWSTAQFSQSNWDVRLYKDGAGQLALRNGAAAQTFNVYGTWSSASVYERMFMRYNGTALAFQVGTEQLGASSRPLHFSVAGTTRMTLEAPGGSNTVSMLGIANSNCNILALRNSSNVNKFEFNLSASGNAGLYVGTNVLITETGSSYFNGGNVGIGTTAPTSRLHVQATGQTGVRENLLKCTVSDSGNDAFYMANATVADGSFVPGFIGAVFSSSARYCLNLAGQTTAANDTGTAPMVAFSTAITTDATDPNNGTLSAVGTRPLFTWVNFTTTHMQMAANGNLGIGTTSPSSKLHVAGNALFGENTTSPTLTPIKVSFGGTYGTSTAGSRANLKWEMYSDGIAANTYGIGMSVGVMEFQAGATGGFNFYPNNTTVSALSIASSGACTHAGNLIFAPDNTYDIGASGANRPRNVLAAGFLQAGAAQAIGFNTRSYLKSPSDGVMTLVNTAETDFNRIQLGGTSASFPSLKRSSTTLQARLADDTAFAPIQGKLTTDTAYTGTVVAATGYITIYDSTGTAYRVPCAV